MFRLLVIIWLCYWTFRIYRLCFIRSVKLFVLTILRLQTLRRFSSLVYLWFFANFLQVIEFGIEIPALKMLIIVFLVRRQPPHLIGLIVLEILIDVIAWFLRRLLSRDLNSKLKVLLLILMNLPVLGSLNFLFLWHLKMVLNFIFLYLVVRLDVL